MSSSFFVERLTLCNWFFQIFPQAWRKKGRVFVFDAKNPALKIAQRTGGWAGVPVEKLVFRLVDIRDENGLLVRERIPAKDMWEIRSDILSQPFFRQLIALQNRGNHLATYLLKTVTTVDRFVRGTLFKAVLLVQIVHWLRHQRKLSGEDTCLYLIRRPWKGAIRRYGERFGVRPRFCLPMLHINLRSPWVKNIYLAVLHFLWFLKHRKIGRVPGKKISDPKLIVQYYSRLNLDHPELFSEFFFWQESGLEGKDIAGIFEVPLDPVDAAKWDQLSRHNIHPIILHPKATTVAQCPPFRPRGKRPHLQDRLHFNTALLQGVEKRWLQRSLKDYGKICSYWHDIFSKHGGKIFLTWYRYDNSHCAIAEAMREIGGILAIHQWALDTSPHIDTLIDCDVAFGYSRYTADLEKRTGSKVPYFVITGFLGDHRFELLKPQAQTVRQKLLQNGAKRILAFLDENSGDDSRWHTGHEFMRVNYQFLLEKVLENPWLGLVMKPKTPTHLRRRLGPILPLLKKALATGRVHMYEAGPVLSYYPPSAAAVSADIAIHGCLAAATAGLECALTGVPTLLMDRESWPVSPLYRLGEGRVVFKNWENLWETLQAHWNRPGSVPGFGDWSSMIGEFDPFRDGKAAHRMGTYLMWLLDGFKAKLPREKVLEEAAQRYREQWGADKVLSINS